MSLIRLASRYSKSLLQLAKENKKLEEVYQDMTLLHQICTSNRDFVLMLKSPIIKRDMNVAEKAQRRLELIAEMESLGEIDDAEIASVEEISPDQAKKLANYGIPLQGHKPTKRVVRKTVSASDVIGASAAAGQNAAFATHQKHLDEEGELATESAGGPTAPA